MKYYTDGWMKGSKNPSPYGGGFTIVDEKNTLIKFEDIEKSGFTNNEAEILGILQALNICNDGDTVSTDSMCCLTWVNAGKSKSRPDLSIALKDAHMLWKAKGINLMWEGRKFNLAGIYNEEMHKSRLFSKEDREEYNRQVSFLNSI